MKDGARKRGQRKDLLGRSSECAVLEALIGDVTRGESRALVLKGEAGIGKTALLAYLVAGASELAVASAVGVESEKELAYGGVHQLCAPFLDWRTRLPAPQREALEVVFGLSGGGAPNRLLVGLAVLSLLAEASEARPVLCVVDDAQWLDQSSLLTLAFVARRLLAEPVGLVFAVREMGDQLRHLATLEVEGLRNGDAGRLLSSAARFRLDQRVRDRIIAESRGNPLALLELPRGLSPGDLAGFGTGDMSAISNGVEESFRRRILELPPETRKLLLIAAAEPLGESILVWRAAGLQGVCPEAADPAVEEGLCEFGARVRFRHPLVRSAAYRAGSLAERRQAHASIAEATDGEADLDRRAWHLAHASASRDDAIADELERAAGRARARGGHAAEAAFLARSVGLTLDASRRAQRALAAGEAKRLAGLGEEALQLAAVAEVGPLTSPSVGELAFCGAAWPRCNAARATRRRNCSARPSNSNGPTAGLRATSIETRSSLPCWWDASPLIQVCPRSPPPYGWRRPRPIRPVRPTSFSTLRPYSLTLAGGPALKRSCAPLPPFVSR